MPFWGEKYRVEAAEVSDGRGHNVKVTRRSMFGKEVSTHHKTNRSSRYVDEKGSPTTRAKIAHFLKSH